MSDYTITYITMEMGFIVIVAFLALRMTKNIGTIREIRHFRLIQTFFILEACMQIIWALDHDGRIQLPRWGDWLVSLIYVLSFCLCMQEWFQYIVARTMRVVPKTLLRNVSVIHTVLTAVHVLLIVTSVWTKWIFYIDEQGTYIRGDNFWMNAVLCYSHWFMAAILIISCRNKVRHTVKMRLRKVFMISCVPVIGGMLQGLYYNVPFVDLSMTLATLFLFIVLQETHVRTDALTGLNNRARFNYAYERHVSRAETEPFYIFVADVDHFKYINDTYGHLEGDKVLSAVANGLKKLGARYPFLEIYRYGGDEFVLLARSSVIGDKDAFAAEINESILQEEASVGLGFSVQLSVGYCLIDEVMDGKKAFQKADAMLYSVKREKHIRSGIAQP